MRCNWLTLARDPFRSFVYPPASLRGARPPNAPFSGVSSLARWPKPNRALQRPSTLHLSSFSTATNTSLSSSDLQPSFHSPVPPTPSPLPTGVLNASLTSAQMAQGAAYAVRLSVKKGALEDACFVVNSLQYTKLRSQPELLKNLDSTSLAQFESAAARFDGEVSPRLAAHALLHELLRAGLADKARSFAKTLMENNVSLRSKTLHAVMQSIYQSALPHSRTLPLNYLFKDSRSVHLSPSLSQNPTTSFAIELLTLAKKSRSGRTDAMFDTLIALCIVNGEIIVASLLFGLLIRSFPSKQVSAPISGSSEDEAVHQPQAREKLPNGRKLYWRSISDWIRPMFSILDAINKTLQQDGQGEKFEHSVRSALQALANMAGLLNAQQIPSWSIAPLLRTMYNCPKVEQDVWVLDKDGNAYQTDNYSYLHGVLKRLIFALPNHPPKTSDMIARKGVRMLPPLDIHGYNSLLHYALRHRLSPEWANHILEHMTAQRFKPLQPDVTTFNILLRSGTLIRRSDIASTALKILKLGETPKGSSPKFASQNLGERQHSRFSKHLEKLKTEKFDSSALEKAVKSAIRGDSYTLSAYIAHLTATGSLQGIEPLTFRILPGLRTADLPAFNDLTPLQRVNACAAHRQQALQRIVRLGPYVLTALLNALAKAGKTSLAEWVWLWVKAAESLSRKQTEVTPWCLPIHAYTIMVSCYAREARRGRIHRATSMMTQGEAPKPHQYVLGYGRFLEKQDRLLRRQMQRGTLGRRLGLLVYRSMQSAAHDIYNSYKTTRLSGLEAKACMPIPKPDAEFFNALLDVLRHRAGSPRRSQECMKDRCRYVMRRANEMYGQYGVTPSGWSEELESVAEDMLDAGYSVPAGIRHLFVGRRLRKGFNAHTSIQLNRRPFAFSNMKMPERSSDGHLPTYKTKGLPLPRKGVARRRHRNVRRRPRSYTRSSPC